MNSFQPMMERLLPSCNLFAPAQVGIHQAGPRSKLQSGSFQAGRLPKISPVSLFCSLPTVGERPVSRGTSLGA